AKLPARWRGLLQLGNDRRRGARREGRAEAAPRRPVERPRAQRGRRRDPAARRDLLALAVEDLGEDGPVSPHRAAGSVARKLASSRFPSTVRIDSGWNCTPSTAWVRCRTPMISPSAVQAERSSTGGSVAGSITSE